MIPKNLLESVQATLITLNKAESLFEVGQKARYFFQVQKGCVQMYNTSEDGKKYVQGIFKDGKSFGEPPLFTEQPYPASAIVLEDTSIWKLPKEDFFNLLLTNSPLHLILTTTLAKRLHYKAMISAELSMQSPEHRLLNIIDYYKSQDLNHDQKTLYQVTFTRQQLAMFTGLRVETVIRTLKSLESQGAVQIIDRKIYR